MNSRQVLESSRGGSNEFIYKPGFIDDHSLESVKMAVDKELSLVSNSFYKVAEGMSKNKSSLEVLYEQAVSEVTDLRQQLSDLKDRVSALESATP